MSATYECMYVTEANAADCCVNCGMPTQVMSLSTTFSVHNSKEDMMFVTGTIKMNQYHYSDVE